MMKLAVRSADKIVGVSVVLAAAVLVFVIFLIGTNHRWFSRDYAFATFLDSATGVAINMAVQHRGFTIGQVRSVRLTEDDRVEVGFVIFDTFIDRARAGSLVEVIVSPVGLGSQFLFLPGLGADALPEGSVIPLVGTPEAALLTATGLTAPRAEEDGIMVIIERAAYLLLTLNEALGGTEETAIGRTVLNIEGAAAGIRAGAEGLAALEPALENIRAITEAAAAPGGTVMAMLDGEGDFYRALAESLLALSGTLRSVETVAAYVPDRLPQITAILMDVQTVLRGAEDVLVALANNPLLRRGVPPRPEAGPGGALARELEF